MAIPDPARLAQIAARLTAPLSNGGRAGIGAFDESPSTLGKRLTSAGLPTDAATRCAWRECLYGAKLAENGLAGVISFEEALDQTARDGRPLPSLLTDQGVLIGIKADQGLAQLDVEGAAPEETHTRGLERLAEASAAWAARGAAFTKWRAALRLDAATGAPTAAAITANADELAEYALVSQRAGLVPIVEPELLIDGAHDADAAAAALTRVLTAVVSALTTRGVHLPGVLLKIMAVVPGADAAGARPPDATLAAATLDVLDACLPAETGGVVFLSGGLSEEGATCLLQATAVAARARTSPWPLSFSFGRALQASSLCLWAAGWATDAEAAALPPARAAVEAAARVNAAAAGGVYSGPHPAAGQGDLREGFRGFRDVEKEARERTAV